MGLFKKNNKAEEIKPIYREEVFSDELKKRSIATLSINLVMAANHYLLLGTALHDERGVARAHYIRQLGIELITKVEDLHTPSRLESKKESAEENMTFLLRESDEKQKVYSQIMSRNFSSHGQALTVDQLFKSVLMLSIALLSCDSSDLKSGFVLFCDASSGKNLRSLFMGDLITQALPEEASALKEESFAEEEGVELVSFAVARQRRSLGEDIDSVTAFLNSKKPHLSETVEPPVCLLLDAPRSFPCQRVAQRYNAFCRQSGRM